MQPISGHLQVWCSYVFMTSGNVNSERSNSTPIQGPAANCVVLSITCGNPAATHSQQKARARPAWTPTLLTLLLLARRPTNFTVPMNLPSAFQETTAVLVIVRDASRWRMKNETIVEKYRKVKDLCKNDPQCSTGLYSCTYFDVVGDWLQNRCLAKDRG